MTQNEIADDIAIKTYHDSYSTEDNSCLLKFPANLIPVIRELSRLSNKTVDDVITSHIVTMFLNICDSREMTIQILHDVNEFYKQVKSGINELYGCDMLDNVVLHEQPSPDVNSETLPVVINLPSRLQDLIDRFCQLVNREKEDLFVELVAWNIRAIYKEEEIFLDCFDNLHPLLDEVEKEILSLFKSE